MAAGDGISAVGSAIAGDTAFSVALLSPYELLLALLIGPDSGVYRCCCICFGCLKDCLEDDLDGVQVVFPAVGLCPTSSSDEAGGETSEETGCS